MQIQFKINKFLLNGIITFNHLASSHHRTYNFPLHIKTLTIPDLKVPKNIKPHQKDSFAYKSTDKIYETTFIPQTFVQKKTTANKFNQLKFEITEEAKRDVRKCAPNFILQKQQTPKASEKVPIYKFVKKVEKDSD
ncbi:Hypothetical_protein [Hexamita inflata]|uniref:Hypothetical_protein n=1 Tax=Hexamita inflata TaxID=28002 RepID=A0AA86N7T2_9EUKA|nr:Hypothetical protein HINF_LOCUS2083 [Hexamita inflata]